MHYSLITFPNYRCNIYKYSYKQNYSILLVNNEYNCKLRLNPINIFTFVKMFELLEKKLKKFFFITTIEIYLLNISATIGNLHQELNSGEQKKNSSSHNSVPGEGYQR